MRLVIVIILSMVINIGFTQNKDALYTIKSSNDMDNKKAISVNIYTFSKDALEDKTMFYALLDLNGRYVMSSLSNKDGVIPLLFSNLSCIRYVSVGGPGWITKKIDLKPFKGKDVDLSVEVKQDISPLH